MILATALLLATAPAGREALGVFANWGAFRDDSPRRCFAIAQPVDGNGRALSAGFASVADWPGQNLRGQLHVRLSRARGGKAGVTLSIGDRRFDLVAGPTDAWAPESGTDAAIVAAMRGGRSMSVETVSSTGTPFADIYVLTGAATAIDTATLACRG